MGGGELRAAATALIAAQAAAPAGPTPPPREPQLPYELPKRGRGPAKPALFVRISPEMRDWVDDFTARQQSSLGDVTDMALRVLRDHMGEGR